MNQHLPSNTFYGPDDHHEIRFQTRPYFPLKHFFYCWLSKIDRKMAVVVVVINTKKNNNNQTKKVVDVGGIWVLSGP